MSFLISILLFISFYQIGFFVQKNFIKKNESIFKDKVFFISIGLIVFQFWTSIIALFNNKNLYLIGGVIFILMSFLINLSDYKKESFTRLMRKIKLRNLITNYTRINFFKIIEYLILISYFFCCLIPITSADSLDYHLGSAYMYLNSNTHDPTWYTSLLALNGEKMIATLIAINAKESIQIIQFIGLLNIYFIFNKFGKFIKVNNTLFLKSKLFDVFRLSIISAPIVLFLTVTAKPQLFPISLICLAFFIILNNEDNKYKFDKLNFLFINILIISAFLNKLTLIIPSFITYFYYFYDFIKNNGFNFKQVLNKITIIFCIFLIIFSPLLIHRYIYFETDLFRGIIFPLNKFGDYGKFIFYLRDYKESPFIFPFFVLFPYNFSTLTTILGMSPVVILYFSYIYKKISNLLFIFINIFIISFFIPSSTRFFYPYFIILSIYLIKIILNSSESNSRIISYKKTKYLNKLIITLIITQSLILLGAVNYYNLEFINASIKNQKSEFLERKINHFDVNKYLSKNLNKNKVIFTDARIRGFSKLNIANLDPLTFKSKESKSHLLEYARLKNIKFSEYIYIVNTSDSSIGNLINQCIKSKPQTFYSKYKTRNIFSELNNKTEKWNLREVKFSDLLNCSSY